MRETASGPPPDTGTDPTVAVLVEVEVSGQEALETAARLAGEIRDLVSATEVTTPTATVSAAVGLRLDPRGGATTTFPGHSAAGTALLPQTGAERDDTPEKFATEVPFQTLAAAPPATADQSSFPQPAAPPALRMYPARRVAFLGDQPLTLTRREFDLLQFLAEHPGRVFGRPQLLRLVWGHQVICGERTVDVHIRRLRAKLATIGPTIATVRGVGYRLDGPERVAVVHDLT